MPFIAYFCLLLKALNPLSETQDFIELNKINNINCFFTHFWYVIQKISLADEHCFKDIVKSTIDDGIVIAE